MTLSSKAFIEATFCDTSEGGVQISFTASKGGSIVIIVIVILLVLGVCGCVWACVLLGILKWRKCCFWRIKYDDPYKGAFPDWTRKNYDLLVKEIEQLELMVEPETFEENITF